MKIQYYVYLRVIIFSCIDTITVYGSSISIHDRITTKAFSEGKRSINNFSEILRHASDLKLSEAIMSKLEGLSDRDKKEVISMINKSLLDTQQVSNALELCREINSVKQKKEKLEFQRQAKIFRNYLDNRFVHGRGSLESRLHSPFGGGDFH